MEPITIAYIFFGLLSSLSIGAAAGTAETKGHKVWWILFGFVWLVLMTTVYLYAYSTMYDVYLIPWLQ